MREDEFMVTRHLDHLVARGNTSDVYLWGVDAVVKVLRPEIPHEWAMREATTTRMVHTAGLPAPAVLDTTTIEDRPGIIFERIPGVSMWEQMLANPREIPELATLLARLQAEVSATPAPIGMPALIDRLRENVAAAGVLSHAEREAALDELANQNTGNTLCHFDVHPNNVLMGPDGPIVIDWFDAAAGDPGADVVRASVLMRHDAALGHLPCANPAIIDQVHDRYLATVVQIRDLDPGELPRWERTVLASRLAEPTPEPVKRATYDTWVALGNSKASRLTDSLKSMDPGHPLRTDLS
jgi:aminoglycoside phosphotransferase (APT) family kinase protein